MAQPIKASMKTPSILFSAIVLIHSSCNYPEPATEKTLDLGFNTAYLDSSNSACDNFFDFTSNGWKEMHPIPATEGRWGSFNILVEENNTKLKKILDGLGEQTFEKGSYQQLVSDMYTSAMDTIRIEKRGLADVNLLLSNLKLKSKAELPSFMATLKKKGVTIPMSVYVGPDEKNSKMNILSFQQSGLGLPDRDYYLRTDAKSLDILLKYEQHISNMLGLAHIEKAEEKAGNILTLEAKLAGIQMSRTDRRSPENTYNKMSRDELSSLMPHFDLNAFWTGIGVELDTLICGQPEYMKGLSQIIMETDLSVWESYFQWHTLNSFTVALPIIFRDEHFDFFGKTLKGQELKKARWKVSISLIEYGLEEQLGRLFSDQYFPESSKETIAKMVENIRTAYGDRVNQLSWMSDETKKKAHEKLTAFTYKIGYPDHWKDYSNLDVNPESLLLNLQNIRAYLFQENIAKAANEVDKSEWYMGAHIVNAYYNPSFNEIVFPAGILQPPFFNPQADMALNYGAIGGVIGHEFTHGFDDEGSKYDAHGNLVNWWTETDRARFDTLAKRLVDQYNKYEALPGEFVNGKMTLGENIADLGGLTIAYHAYIKSLEGKPTPTVINGFSHQQRFFLGWAGVWQVHYKEQTLRDRLITDYHSPGNFRVVGPMSNMPEFGAAFNCTAPSPMQKPKENQILIW